ncbi:MAG: hypothetical protein Q8P84_09185 [Deltaproteobacteria bacterium]|nr:hypothetical protein [Deltaproteobacteria bacterium]
MKRVMLLSLVLGLASVSGDPSPSNQKEPKTKKPRQEAPVIEYGPGPNMPPPQPMQEEQNELEQPAYYEVPRDEEGL